MRSGRHQEILETNREGAKSTKDAKEEENSHSFSVREPCGQHVSLWRKLYPFFVLFAPSRFIRFVPGAAED
jgi:hypothetical protein